MNKYVEHEPVSMSDHYGDVNECIVYALNETNRLLAALINEIHKGVEIRNG